jgi:uncharacterized protein
MKIENEFVVAAPIAGVWSAITDPAAVAPCIPGCEDVEVHSPTFYKAKLRIQVGPIKARFALDILISDQRPPEKLSANVRGEEGSRASVLKADVSLCLQAVDIEHTRVFFETEVTIVGRLGTFGLGVMKKKSQELTDRFTADFRAKVEMPHTASAVGASDA